ncbi:MAG: YnfA family protein [Scytolyngbya sp. HA4215-MV1]|jgi:small multidrug resistance family-3 protein|nr:YnfA family protein [Scytolyngbya sp. HA4215-MV1]
MLKSLFYFLVAGLCEIGGGYLVWQWIREGKSGWLAVNGAILLTIYGFVATLQPVNFGRAYAAYGGVFIILSIVWGWQVDKMVPDRLDWVGAAIVLMGVLIMMYAPRAQL